MSAPSCRRSLRATCRSTLLIALGVTVLACARAPRGTIETRLGDPDATEPRTPPDGERAAAGRATGTLTIAFVLDATSGVRDPIDVAIDPSDRLLVLDSRGTELLLFSAEGRAIDAWSVSGGDVHPFFQPRAIAVTGLTVLLLDPDERLIVRLDSFGNTVGDVVDFDLAADRLGSVDPTDIATDTSGLVFVSDGNHHSVLVMDVFGQRLRVFGGLGSSAGRLRNPTALATSAGGHVFVLDAGNARISKFDGLGAERRSFTLPGGAKPVAVGGSRLGAVAVGDDGVLVELTEVVTRVGRWPGTVPVRIVEHPGGRLFGVDAESRRVVAVDRKAARDAGAR